MMMCRICGNGKNNIVYTVAELMFGYNDRFDYVQCSACGCLQIAEVPSNISKYYPSHYYSFTPKQRTRLNHPIEKLFRRIRDHYTIFNRSVFGAVISAISPNKKLAALSKIDLTKDSRILDVGCGDGWRLYALREIGFKHVLGIDPFIQENIVYDNGVIVHKKFLHEVDGEWDVIMYHHSFEHLSDPYENLRMVGRLLSPHGCCLIRIPTVSSHAWEHYREHWYQLDAPRHFFLHSITSMNILAEKAGFTLQDIVFDSTAAQFQISEQYIRGIPFVSPERIFTKSMVRGWKRLAKKMNQEKRGDQAAFYLVKK